MLRFIVFLIPIVGLSILPELQATVLKKLSCDFSSEFGRGHLNLCAALRDDGTLKLNENLDNLIFYQTNGLADIFFPKEGCYWISSGRVLRKTLCHDKIPEPMSEGLARYIDHRGQFGFVNEKLKIIIPPSYDYAKKFTGQTTWVCKKCLVRPVKFDLNDESTKFAGGEWSIIDKTGTVLKKCARGENFETCKLDQAPTGAPSN
jgi:hypothetical protein